MKDPGRLKEGAFGLERALLDVGARAGSSRRGRKRTLAALGLSTWWFSGLAIAAQKGFWGSKLGIGMSLMGVAAVVAIPTAVVLHGRAQVATGVAAGTSAPLGAETSTPASLLVPVPALPGIEPANDTGARAASLQEELAMVDGARGLIASHRPADALKQLDRYQRVFPVARLEQEAEVLRIEALAQAGRQREAAAHARAFVATHAGSLLASRVKSLTTVDATAGEPARGADGPAAPTGRLPSSSAARVPTRRP